MARKPNPHLGSSFEDYLVERGDFEAVQLLAAKKIAARFRYRVVCCKTDHLADYFIASCDEIPELRWFDTTHDSALAGIKRAARATQADIMLATKPKRKPRGAK